MNRIKGMQRSLWKNVGIDNETKSAVTPAVKQVSDGDDEDELPPRQTTTYRAAIARASYLAQDRSDIAYATKERSRKM